MKPSSNWSQPLIFLKSIDFRFGAFTLSAFCSFLAVLVNLSGLQLLIPLAQGIIRSDYSHVRDHLGIIQFGAAHFPQFFSNPHLSFFPLAAMILTFILIQNLLNYAAALSISRQTKETEVSLRKILLSRYLQFGKRYFDLHNSNEIHHVILNHASVIAGQIKNYHRLFSQCMSLMAIAALLFFLSWRLTLLALLILPTFFITSQWVIQKVRDAARQREAQVNRIRQRIANIAACIPLVKIYSAENEETRLFDRESRLEKNFSFQFEKKSLLIKPIEDINTFLMLIALAAAMSFIRLHDQTTDVSYYLVFFYVLQMAMTRLSVFSEFKIHQTRSQAAFSKLEFIMSDSGKFVVPGGSRPFQKLEKQIEFCDLSFGYTGDRLALCGVNLKIEKGKMTALVGPTGAGKTTLISLLLRFYDCPPRSIFIDGIDIRSFSTSSLMNAFAYVSQDILLLDDTLRANLTYGIPSLISQNDIDEALRTARLFDFAQQLNRGLETPIGERGIQLSGGEKQRLSIARAVLKKADILIFDEATSSLDSQTEKKVQDALKEICRDKTTLVIAHRISTILHADKIVVLNRGKITEEGTLPALIEKKGSFYQYCKNQNFDAYLNQSKS